MTHNPVNAVGDFIAGSVTVGAIMGWLPPMAALMAVLWYCVLFYDRFTKKP